MPAAVLHRSDALTAIDYRCTATPADRPFVECHTTFSISYVRSGSFGYRFRGQSFELVSGSIMVGYPGDEYMCTHEHHECGDECLSFHFSQEMAESFTGSAKSFENTWRVGCVPPLPQLMVSAELAQAAAAGRSDIGIEEAGLMFVSRFVELVSGRAQHTPRAPSHARRRAVEVAMWLDEHSHREIDLDTVSRESGLSTFHFLRLFSETLGVTPHQYLIRSRLRKAARLLADGDRSITDIAADVGFADLSNFIRTFHRAAGASPREFQRAITR
jgi:AraC family transcriptional regulator